MDDLGRKLKHAREERGVSLRDIAERTKISLAALEALERGEFHRLPGGIFSRSVVRTYAAEVGLDPDTTVENFLAYARRYEREAAERVAATRPDISRDDREFLERQQRAVRTLRLVVVVVAAAAVGLLVWQVRRIVAPVDSGSPPASSADVEPAPVAAPPPPPPPPPPESVAQPLAEPAVVTPAPANVPPPGLARKTPEVAAPERPPAAKPPSTDPSPAVAAPASPAAPAVAFPLVVQLTALSDCLINVVRDGGPVESQVLKAGGRLRVEATRDVALTVADAGAVTWRINGRAAKPLGRAGTEVSVRVTPENAAEFLP